MSEFCSFINIGHSQVPGLPQYMGVSKNRVFPPQIIHFNRVFSYKPSILGVNTPYFRFNTHLCSNTGPSSSFLIQRVQREKLLPKTPSDERFMVLKSYASCISKWWFQIFGKKFIPKIGEDEPIWTHIFQMGWFNHQLDIFGKASDHHPNLGIDCYQLTGI